MLLDQNDQNVITNTIVQNEFNWFVQEKIIIYPDLNKPNRSFKNYCSAHAFLSLIVNSLIETRMQEIMVVLVLVFITTMIPFVPYKELPIHSILLFICYLLLHLFLKLRFGSLSQHLWYSFE